MGESQEREGLSYLATDAANDLVAAAQAGDEEAIEKLLQEAMTFLFPSILSLLHTRRARGTYLTETLTGSGSSPASLEEDAWDLTHSTCLAMLRGLHTYRGRSRLGRPIRFTTWLYAIAQNQVRSALRKRWREQQRRHTSAGSAEPEGTHLIFEGIDHRTPEHQTVERVEHELLQEALQMAPLTADQKDAVIMFYVFGYKQERIAQLTGVQVGTVKKRIFDGVRKLRRYMEEAEGGALGTGGV